MEAEKLSICHPRAGEAQEAGGIVQLKPEGLRTRSQWHSSRSESKSLSVRVSVSEAGVDGCLSSSRNAFALPPPFRSVWNLHRLVLNHADKANFLFSLAIPVLTSSGSNLTDTLRKLFYQFSGLPLLLFSR